MNFLAHMYLSGESEGVLIGNFIGDYVKGRDYEKYSPSIRKGILLHRNIDFFTDSHSLTRASRELISEEYGKYSGIVVDIFYDHFLAAGWDQYSDMPLKKYTREKYNILNIYYDIFPGEVKNFFPYFIRSNWLEAYANIEGVQSVLNRMTYRTSLPDHVDFAITSLKNNYLLIKDHFARFFREIMDYVESKHEIKLIA